MYVYIEHPKYFNITFKGCIATTKKIERAVSHKLGKLTKLIELLSKFLHSAGQCKGTQKAIFFFYTRRT